MNTNDIAWKKGFENMCHNGDNLFAIFSYNHPADYKAYQIWVFDTGMNSWKIVKDPLISEDNAIEYIKQLKN